MQTFKIGSSVIWRAWSNSQREALRKHKNWVIAREKPIHHFCGDVCLLVAPVDRMHESRWIKLDFILKITEPEKEATAA